MTSRHLVDPQTLPLLDLFGDFGPLSDATLQDARARILGFFPPPAENDDKVTMRVVTMPGDAGGPEVRALLYEPAGGERPRGAILHIHGGGLVLGAPEGNDAGNRDWAARLNAVILSVDYRLAPEHPYPAGLDDCTAGLRWLHDQADALAIDRARIAVMGESAGGGLAASVALRARDLGLPKLALQMLIYPMLDDRTGMAETDALTGEFIWRAADNRYGWGSYLRGHDRQAPPAAAVPARAESLQGLAPCFMSLGALDLFLDEDLAYARRLMAAGVPTELHVYPGGIHAFDLMPGTAIGNAFAEARFAAMRRALTS